MNAQWWLTKLYFWLFLLRALIIWMVPLDQKLSYSRHNNHHVNYLVGEYSIDLNNDAHDHTSAFDTDKHNTWEEEVTLVFLLLYLFIVNIVILNLIIAFITDKYSEISEEGNKLHRFHLYRLYVNSAKRTIVPLPFCFIEHMFIFFFWVVRRELPCWYRRLYEHINSKWGLKYKSSSAEDRIRMLQLECESARRVYRKYVQVVGGRVVVKNSDMWSMFEWGTSSPNKMIFSCSWDYHFLFLWPKSK